MLLLIDGDILLYRALVTSEQDLRFDEDIHVLMSNHADAKDYFIGKLTQLINHASRVTKIENFLICLSDKENWRKEIYPEYKANRKDVRKPLGMKDFRQWVEDSYDTVTKPKLEADDILGILGTHPDNIGKCVIWSDDKDLMQVPGFHLDMTEDCAFDYVTPLQGEMLHMTQTLTGDQVDNYPGVPNVGPKKAEKILADGPPYWEQVRFEFEKAGFDDDYALTMARISKICLFSDWDAATQQVKLWTPHS